MKRADRNSQAWVPSLADPRRHLAARYPVTKSTKTIMPKTVALVDLRNSSMNYRLQTPNG